MAAALGATVPKSVAHRLLVASLVKANNEAWELKQKDAVKTKTVPMSPVVNDFDTKSHKLFKDHFLIDEDISKEELKTDKRILAALKDQAKHLRDISRYLNPTAQRKNTQLLYEKLKAVLEAAKSTAATAGSGILGGLGDLVGGGVDIDVGTGTGNKDKGKGKIKVPDAKKKPGIFRRAGGKLGKLFGMAAAGIGLGGLFGAGKDAVDGAAPGISPDVPLIDTSNEKTPTTVEQAKKAKESPGKTAKSLPQETLKDVPDAKKTSLPKVGEVLDDDIKVKGGKGGWLGRLTGGMGKMFGVAATVATAIPDVIDTAKVVNDEAASTEEKSRKVGSTTGKIAGGVGGAVAGGNVGAWVGGGIGALFGGVGAVPGAFVGGIIGSAIGGWLGSEGGEAVGDAVGGAVAEALPKEIKKEEKVATPKEAPAAPTATAAPPGVVKDKDVGGTIKEVKTTEPYGKEPLKPYEPPSLGRINEIPAVPVVKPDFKPLPEEKKPVPAGPSPFMANTDTGNNNKQQPAQVAKESPNITVPKLSGEGKATVTVEAPASPAPVPVVTQQEPPVVNVPAPETSVTVEAPKNPTLREKAKAVTSNAVTAYKESDTMGQGVVNAAKSVPKTLKALKDNPTGLSELDQKAASKPSYLESLATRESGPNYQSNNGKYLGAYQMSPIALQSLGYMDEAGNWTGKDNIYSAEAFLNDKKVQDKAAMSLAKTNWNTLNKVPIGEQDGMPVFARDLVGKEIQGVKVTESGLLGAAHLGGASSVTRMLKSGGREMPVDGNDVPIINYLQTMGGKDVSRITGNKDVTDQMGTFSPTPDTRYYLAGTNREVQYKDPKPADRIASLTFPKVASVSDEKERTALAQTKVAMLTPTTKENQATSTAIRNKEKEREASTIQPAPEFPRAQAIEQPSSADISRLENTIKETTVIKEGGTSVIAVNGGNGKDVSINFNNTPIMVNDLGLIVVNNGIL